MDAEPTVRLTFGEWLRRRRRALDLTREKLAGRAACSFETIKKIESGDLKPSAQLAELLALQLNIPVPHHAAFVQFARSGSTMDAFAFTQLPGPAPFRAPDSVPARTLPVPVTSLHGRSRELHAALTLLQRDDVRLLTLTGPPGAGKTRLALALGAQAQSDFGDGTAFVPLAPLTNPLLIVTAVAQVLGVQEEKDRPLNQTLDDALREKHVLVILDNFEQLLPAALQVSQWLSGAPRVKFIVTSREPLRVYGEHILPVPPLELPDVRNLPPPEALMHYSAIELFVARARAVKPDFELTPENADAVAQVCALLDGLPLAIEMAAAQIRRSSPRRLVSQLSKHLVTLTGGLRDLSPRQQTLRGAIDWSYELLSTDERRLFDALGVFVGGSTLDAIRHIVPTDDAGSVEILETHLENLIDKNLLLWKTDEADRARYTMLEMMREYAGEKLRARGEWESACRRHAEYYLALARQTNGDTGEKQTRASLAPEQDNLRAALSRAFEQTDSGPALQLCAEWGAFWLAQGHWREGLDWTQRALAKMEAGELNPEQQRLRARLLHRAGELAERQESSATTRQFYEESLRLRRTLGEPAAIAESLMSMASFCYFTGETQAGLAYGEEGLALCRAIGDQRGSAFFLNHLGRLALSRDDYSAARTYLQESLTISRALGDKANLALAIYNLGIDGLIAGRYDDARNYFFESLELRRTLGDQRGMVQTTKGIGVAAFRLGDYSDAAVWLESSVEQARALNDRYGEAHALINLGYVAFEAGNPELASTYLAASLKIADPLGAQTMPQFLAAELHALIALAGGDYASAHTHATAGLAAWRALNSLEDMAECTRVLGFVALAQGDMAHARTHLAQERALYQATENEWFIAKAMSDMGYLEIQEKHPEDALSLYRETLATASKLGDRRRIAVAMLGIVGVLLEWDRVREAVRMLSAAARRIETLHLNLGFLPHQMRADYLSYEIQARERLDKTEFETEWEQGRTTAPEQIINLSLSAGEKI